MAKQFYIHLPSNAENQSTAALVRHALKALEQEVNDKPVDVVHFDLIRPYTDDDNSGVFIVYTFPSKAEIKLRSHRKELADEIRNSAVLPEKEFYETPITKNRLNSLTLRPKYLLDERSDIKLVESLAAALEDLKGATILDFRFHDYCDEDGLRSPYFVVYFLG